MSTASDTYGCDQCTFIQSINRPSCEMCNAPNPYFLSRISASTPGGAAAAAMMSFPLDDGVITCSNCGYINIGNSVPICEGCKYNLDDFANPYQTFHPDMYDEDPVDDDDDKNKNDYDDDDDVVVVDDNDDSQTNNKRGKQVQAVEKGMNDDELLPYFNRYILIRQDQQRQSNRYTDAQLYDYLTDIFQSLEYSNEKPDGQLVFPACQICMDADEAMITMKACGHRVICSADFHQYLSTRISDGDILPWIPCPAETCFVPCHVDNIIKDGHLTYAELLSFLTLYMLRKLSRNENFITCVKCQKGGFLQIGPPKKQNVVCPICNEKQIIEKGADGDLDIAFKKMIKSGELRECPTCRHLTLKEKGLCNVIECAKCGIWWNWRSREQGQNGRDLKQRARMNGTLWEPGELHYQQDLERSNPNEFKALLERNGIAYNPNYVRGNWDE